MPRVPARTRTATLVALAFALAATLSWSAGDAAASGSAPAGQRATAQPLISTGPWTRYVSPNGDHRHDEAEIGFDLRRPARVSVTVRTWDQRIRGPLSLGRLKAGHHVWAWDGLDAHGEVAPDDDYEAVFTATTATRSRRATAPVTVDTVALRGDLITSRPTVYPLATAVDDQMQLTWALEDWDVYAEILFPRKVAPARTDFTISSATGEVLLRSTRVLAYTPTVTWSGEGLDGAALPEGEYVARVAVRDRAGNRTIASRPIFVSHEQLEQATWSTTIPAADVVAGWQPFLDTCESCGEFCSPVPSERFARGLSFRACDWAGFTMDFFAGGVPFPVSRDDTFRVTAHGGPTTPGSAHHGYLSGVPTPTDDDASTSTDWEKVDLLDSPYLPGQLPARWSFVTDVNNSYDVDTFTVDYRHYVPVADSPGGRSSRRPSGR